MSGTQSSWRYRHLSGDSGKLWKHPYDGLPLSIIDQIMDTALPHTKGKGVAFYFNHFQHWEGPVAEGTATGWTLTGATGAATIVRREIGRASCRERV